MELKVNKVDDTGAKVTNAEFEIYSTVNGK